ncbi:MAG: cache domain-containing protein [Candidatus Omnitrophota bacterium]
MKTISLKTKIILSFLVIILTLGISIGILGVVVIKTNIFERAQQQVKNDLAAARFVYENEIESAMMVLSLVSDSDDLNVLKKKLHFDYLYYVPFDERPAVLSSIAQRAFDGQAAGATRIVGKEELLTLGEGLYDQARVTIIPTPKARQDERRVLEEAMVIECARPEYDSRGQLKGVLVAGRLVNGDFALVDKVHNLVFEERRLYNNKPIGTVTIFQGDVRIATNVLNEKNERAVGTRVSETVYAKVLGHGLRWVNRAFVVTDWYLTAYEPLRDLDGHIIGILYVGILEKPFIDMARDILVVFFVIIVFAVALALILAIILAQAISKPVQEMLAAMGKISKGDLQERLKTLTTVTELNMLAFSFNDMASKLDERDRSLKESHEKLARLNKSYLDLIAFVTHELKGILSSLILNAYTLRDGFLGMVNFKQRKVLDSITRNLDYFASTVKNFFDLSRIEKKEIHVDRKEILLKEDVIDGSMEAFLKQADEKNIEIVNRIQSGLKIFADLDLLQVVANNLIGNAVKYGIAGGRVIIDAKVLQDALEVEVYNDGRPVTDEEKDKLFKRFSRLSNPEAKKARGTGLGLFITKEIIERHGGTVWLEAREAGNAFVFRI